MAFRGVIRPSSAPWSKVCVKAHLKPDMATLMSISTNPSTLNSPSPAVASPIPIAIIRREAMSLQENTSAPRMTAQNITNIGAEPLSTVEKETSNNFNATLEHPISTATQAPIGSTNLKKDSLLNGRCRQPGNFVITTANREVIRFELNVTNNGNGNLSVISHFVAKMIEELKKYHRTIKKAICKIFIAPNSSMLVLAHTPQDHKLPTKATERVFPSPSSLNQNSVLLTLQHLNKQTKAKFTKTFTAHMPYLSSAATIVRKRVN
mmetsp:Transcript_37142/g.148173  ORF Transcript_37142/g.148173 Transcript_37142/m.148173 type:complete len:264 (+) Transcript_37142:1204-1995(+)